MDSYLIATVLVSGAVVTFLAWIRALKFDRQMSGDQWYMTQFAFTREAISAPYCWRPLVPILARHFGFRPVSFAACFLTPLIVFGYTGGGWRGFACALLFMGNGHIFILQMKNPHYAESVGHLLFIGTLWAMSADHVSVWPLLLLCALCRETLSAALGLIAVVWNPWWLIPLIAGSVVAYFGRREDKDNRHPLVEEGPYETVKRWAHYKGFAAFHYAHVIQPLRGLAYAVPFVWQGVSDFSRVGLIGFAGIWLLALPASGQSRIICYAFGLLIPFAAALPGVWLWFLVLVCVFWPIDFNVFNETGGTTFAYARG